MVGRTGSVAAKEVKVLKGFRNFLMRGDIVVVAVGLAVALAFSALIAGFTADIPITENLLSSITVSSQNQTGWARTIPYPTTSPWGQSPFVVDPDVRAKLTALTRELGITDFMLLQSAVAVALAKSGEGLDIPLGTVKTNVLRGREKLKKTLAAWAG